MIIYTPYGYQWVATTIISYFLLCYAAVRHIATKYSKPDYSLIPWDGKKYLVYVHDIYDDLRLIIDTLIDRFPVGGPLSKPETQTAINPSDIPEPGPYSTPATTESKTTNQAPPEQTSSTTKDSPKIQLKDLQAILENVLNVSIVDINKILKSRLESNRNINNKLFIDNLSNYAEIFLKDMAKYRIILSILTPTKRKQYGIS